MMIGPALTLVLIFISAPPSKQCLQIYNRRVICNTVRRCTSAFLKGSRAKFRRRRNDFFRLWRLQGGGSSDKDNYKPYPPAACLGRCSVGNRWDRFSLLTLLFSGVAHIKARRTSSQM